MALPKSTFVMGLVTLGLFGLAIRATAKHDDPPVRDRDDIEADEPDEDEAPTRADQEAAEQARMVAEREESAKELALLGQQMRQLYSVEAASPGSLFDGIVLERSPDTIGDAADSRLSTFRQITDSSVEIGTGFGRPPRIDRIEVEPSSDGESSTRSKVCTQLAGNLTDAWGRGNSIERDELTVWLNPSTHTRATFKPGSRCVLTFEHFVDADLWVARTPGSVVPLSMIGQPAEKAAASVGSVLEDDTIEWHGPGLGAGTSGTELKATVVKGKVVMVIAETHVAPAARADVEAELTKLFGKPITGDDEEVLSWKGRPPISLEVLDDRLVLSVGRLLN